MRSWLSFTALAFVITACGSSGSGTTDSGTDSGGSPADAAVDARGTDAGDAIARTDAFDSRAADTGGSDGNGGDVLVSEAAMFDTPAAEASTLDVAIDATNDVAIDVGNDTGNDTGPASTACVGDTLDANRNRLLEAYYQFLEANATQPQMNGLSAAGVSSALDVWSQLNPSAQAVFLTLTARMQGSILGSDGSSMLSHVTNVYWIMGGTNSTQTDPGDCGGAGNRMIMSMDATLHDAQVAANNNQGARQSNGRYDISDVDPSSYWRDSHDLGGAHSPFDLSDETNGGAPRGQTQYFADPSSSVANSPLGRPDLQNLVDPYALEMDQDYDCTHNSNPLCTYTTYGRFCFPETSEPGTQVYTDSYGDYGASYQPQPCGP